MVLATENSRLTTDLLPADVNHGAGGWNEVRFADVLAGPFFEEHHTNELLVLRVGGAAPDLRVQIVIPDGEQASANFSVGSDADAAAMSAERMRDRRDDADLAEAVVKTVTAGGF